MGGEHSKWERTSYSSQVFDAMPDAYLYQHIMKPTRQRSGPQPFTLDLVFSNEQYMVDNVTHLALLGYSDESLRWSYICYAEAPAKKTLSGSRNYPKGDYDVINKSLSKTDWESKFHGEHSVNTNWTELKKEISKAVREKVPLRNVKCKMNNKPPWWSKEMLIIVKRKYNLYKHYNSSGLDRDY